jgi:hypothetical protein
VILQGPTGENNNKMWDSRKFLPRLFRVVTFHTDLDSGSVFIRLSARIQHISIGAKRRRAFRRLGRRRTLARDLSPHHLIDGSRVRRTSETGPGNRAVARARHNNKMLRLSAFATDWAV